MTLLPGGNERELPNKPKVKAHPAEDSSINVSPYYVAFFVLCMGAMLLLLYFFFDYLGKLFIVLNYVPCFGAYNLHIKQCF